MKFPAQAFGQLHPSEMPAGSLFKTRDCWSLRVSGGSGFEGALILEGERAGWVVEVRASMAPALGIIAPFSWFPMVLRDAKPALDADRTVTLTLSESGPILMGADARRDWDRDYISFGIDGRSVELQDEHRALRFAQWTVELCHKSRPYSSLGTLCEVDRRGT